ncbi:DUF4177 domain-containing protein [Alkalimarinus alittae]|uniref:DUF4177 domain-containing protein n=1 Tax=Alkalimarinus alittae TaxID=2961619 RepID=A0ABY6N1D9_9ALTE|nr:DUF4177 domain-containing protein [Alkalimarinus alittae]UZE95915.1 DUF4177 domain-containing protein [Alkalimarinus alittae]
MNWEYKTVRFDKRKFVTGAFDVALLNEKLNTYGEQGWELVSFETKQATFGQDIGALAIFKRVK